MLLDQHPGGAGGPWAADLHIQVYQALGHQEEEVKGERWAERICWTNWKYNASQCLGFAPHDKIHNSIILEDFSVEINKDRQTWGAKVFKINEPKKAILEWIVGLQLSPWIWSGKRENGKWLPLVFQPVPNRHTHRAYARTTRNEMISWLRNPQPPMFSDGLFHFDSILVRLDARSDFSERPRFFPVQELLLFSSIASFQKLADLKMFVAS